MKFLQPTKLPAEEQTAFEKDLQANQKQVDKAFAKLLAIQWVLGVACACFISPLAWEGTSSSLHLHVAAAVVLGGLIVLPPILLARQLPGHLTTRLFIASGQVLFSALLIHLMAGRIEAHFHVFVSMALLAAYKDYRVFIPATLIVATDHLVRGFLWPQSVFGVLTVIPWRAFEHAIWVLFEVAGLSYLINKGLVQMKRVAKLQGELERKSRQLEVEVLQRTAELGESHDFQESILNSVDYPVSVIDSAGRIEFGNKEFWNLSRKLSSGENYIQIGFSYEKLWESDAEKAEKLKKSLHRIATGEAKHYTGEHALADASERTHFDISAKPILFGGQRCVAIIHCDLTEKIEKEQEIEATRSAWLNSPVQLALIDVKTNTFVEINEALLEGIGQTRENVLATQLSDFVDEEYGEALASILQQVAAVDPSKTSTNDAVSGLDCRLKCSDNTLLPARLTFQRLKLGKSDVVAVYGLDMTPTEILARKYSDSQPLALVGQLASGLYENNQADVELLGENLQDIKCFAEELQKFSQQASDLLGGSSESDSKLQELQAEFQVERTLGKINNAAIESEVSLGRLVRSYKAVGSLGKTDFSVPELVDIRAVIEDARIATESQWSIAKFEVEDEADEPIMVEGQAAELRLAMVQLILNACEGILKRAELREEEYRGQIKVRVESTDEYALVSVSDNGVQIANIDESLESQQRPRLGECQAAFKSLHGELKVENGPEAGIVTKVRLPKKPAFDDRSAQPAKPLLFPAVATVPGMQTV